MNSINRLSAVAVAAVRKRIGFQHRMHDVIVFEIHHIVRINPAGDRRIQLGARIGTAGIFSCGAPKMCSTLAMFMPRAGIEGPVLAWTGAMVVAAAGAAGITLVASTGAGVALTALGVDVIGAAEAGADTVAATAVALTGVDCAIVPAAGAGVALMAWVAVAADGAVWADMLRLSAVAMTVSASSPAINMASTRWRPMLGLPRSK